MSTEEYVDRNRLWSRLTAAVDEYVAEHRSGLPLPLAVVDLDAFDANAAAMARRAGGTPIRVASKSLRVPDLVRRALGHDGFRGVLAYTLAEALWLVEHEITGDVLVAYPTVDTDAVARLVASPRMASMVTLMIDDRAHLDVVDSVRSSKAVQVRVAIDVDAGLRVGGQHVGPRRSPLHEAADVLDLARTVVDRHGFRLVGVMTYEGQVAGVPDDVPGQRARSAVVRRLKAASVDQLADRRRELVAGLRELTDLEFLNAGGTGSLAESAADEAVTELSAGSGLFAPTLFDHYRGLTLTPAAFFGLPVTRRPGPQVATVHGGGLVASGPAGTDRLPAPWAPPGLTLTALEGAGEVQTPVRGHPADLLRIGDLVWFRHAKAGELCEHVNAVRLLSGRSFVGTAETYRGHGLVF